jgi:NAD(P)-dependent dehydrogenase (short-subunit alcohol dehydrogenase family)
MFSAMVDRRVVVTGASSGIGFVVARSLARAGARLTLMARGREGLQAAARAVAGEGADVSIVVVDVTDRAAVDAAMAQAAGEMGRIDVLVSSVAGLASGAFTELSPEGFDRSHETRSPAWSTLCGRRSRSSSARVGRLWS